ncbi:MAG: hypothetical protein EOP80_04865 [Variovorax sp.]|nr:MAG: hypothetical protein EOP80_04865 [Variovorax sp.]
MLNSSSLVTGMSPLRKLLLAALLSVVLAQIAAMALVARSQVLKAELREAAEMASRRVNGFREPAPQNAAVERPQAVTVGYAVSR